MNHRHRAQSRLQRHVPQLRSAEAGALHGRLTERQEEADHHERSAPGDSLVLRGMIEGKPKFMKGADVSENAPLLMRLVRHPYAMYPVNYGRIEGRASYKHVRHEPLGPALSYRQELRDAYRLIVPMEEFAHRPEARRRPFATRRHAQADGAPREVTGLPLPDDAMILRGAWSGAPMPGPSGEAS